MKPIGILGGGQLARMLALEAHRLGLPVAVLSPNENDPARAVAGTWIQGDPNSPKALAKFLPLCSSVTFESEFYDADVIAAASRQSGVSVWPNPKLMGSLQDRLSQKNLIDEYEIPTAAWRPVDSSQDALVAYVAFDGEVVYKKRRGGYDGYGTFVVRDDGALGAFANDGVKEPFIAERLVKFKREVAVIAVRDQKGSVFFYPLVESKQKDSRCLWVKGPLKETKALSEIKKSLTRFLKGIDYVGAMGIELFETKSGYLVNEIAPRVHNTGHYTMDAFTMSQFALHLRAVAGLSVGGQNNSVSKAFAMWNLLGSKKSAGLTPWNNTLRGAELEMHWYGKAESRDGRKMGHVNALGKTVEAALATAKKATARLRKEIGY